MSLAVLVKCDGAWDEGRMPCRAAFPFRLVYGLLGDQLEAFSAAADAQGWTDGETEGTHLCPAHSRLAGGTR